MSQSLSPDAELVFYELTTTGGATIFFKPGPDVSYLGNEYLGVPLSFSGFTRSVEPDAQKASLKIGGENFDLAILKTTLFSGEVDGATVYRYVAELEDVLNNIDRKVTDVFTVKQVEGYSRSQISLVLGRFSPTPNTTIPYKKYLRPAFPYVEV